MPQSLIRRVHLGDENILAYIQTESWKAAFQSILDPATLEKCTELERAVNMYKMLLEQQIGNGYILEVEGIPHAIAWWDAAREKEMGGYAEIICIHSLKGHWRQGYGGRLMDQLLSDITDAGYSKVMLWVFTENDRARRFYEVKGFTATDKIQPAMGTTEICYIRQLP